MTDSHNSQRRIFLSGLLASGTASALADQSITGAAMPGSLLPQPNQLIQTAAWGPGVGYKFYTYEAGTLTNKATYSDAALTIANANPVVANARGEVTMYGSGAYRIIVKDALDSTIYDRDNVESAQSIADTAADTAANNLKDQLAASTGTTLVGWIRNAIGAVATTLSKWLGWQTLDVFEFMTEAEITDVTSGAPTLNHSAAVLAAFNALKARGGGTLKFPNNKSVYKFYLDVSGTNPPMVFDFQGSKIRPFSTTPTNSTIIYANNESLGFASTNITLVRPRFDCRVSGTGSGDINYAVYLHWACIDAERPSIEYAKVAGVYGNYAQYTKLIDPVFGANDFGATTWGAYFTGPDGAHRSNEVHLVRPKFFSNRNGLFIGGGEDVRVTSPTVQDQRAIGIEIGVDAAGNGARGTYISDPWFEINVGYSIKVGVADSTVIDSPKFLTDGALTIQATHCYDLAVYNAYALANPVSDLKHPSANTDTASLTWKGGNFVPTIALDHNGPTQLDIDIAAKGRARKDNLLLTSGQTSQGVPTVGMPNWFGTKENVAKGVATNLFNIKQQAHGTPAYRVAVFTLEIFMWDDFGSTSQYGYSGHTQRYAVMISNNGTGAPQISIVKESAGVDVGISTSYQAPGDVSIGSSVSGDTITFTATWSGTGSGVAGMSRQTIAYMLHGAGTNGFYMGRL